MKYYFFVLVIGLGGISLLNAQELQLEKIQEYALPEGYDCTSMEVVNERVVITCPSTNSFFYLESGVEAKMQEITYTIGRGPGEMGRAPLGIGILDEKIILLDPDLRRLLVYDTIKNEFNVIKLDMKEVVLGLYSTYKEDTVFLKTRSGLQRGKEIGYFYNVNTSEKSKVYSISNEISIFEASGRVEVMADKILFGSLQGGFITEWNINGGNNISQQWKVFDAETTPRKVSIKGRPGLIPANSEYKMTDIDFNPVNKNQFFLLISPTGEGGVFRSNLLYVFDRKEGKIVQRIELEGGADLMEVESGFIFLHYEDEDKLVKYEVKAK